MRPTIFRASILVLCALSGAAIGCGGGAAQSTEQSGGTSSSGGTSNSGGEQAEALTLDDFAAQVGAGVAQAECAPQGSLGQCYTVTADVCATAFLTAMRECANNLRAQLPAMVDMSNVDATSQTLGLCAVEAYHLGLTQAGVRQQTPECQPTQ